MILEYLNLYFTIKQKVSKLFDSQYHLICVLGCVSFLFAQVGLVLRVAIAQKDLRLAKLVRPGPTSAPGKAKFFRTAMNAILGNTAVAPI